MLRSKYLPVKRRSNQGCWQPTNIGRTLTCDAGWLLPQLRVSCSQFMQSSALGSYKVLPMWTETTRLDAKMSNGWGPRPVCFAYARLAAVEHVMEIEPVRSPQYVKERCNGKELKVEANPIQIGFLWKEDQNYDSRARQQWRLIMSLV